MITHHCALDCQKLFNIAARITAFVFTPTSHAGLGDKFFFSNCHIGCMSKQDVRRGGWHDWCWQLADMWRTSNDIYPSWSSVMHNLQTMVGISHQAGFVRNNDSAEDLI